MMGLDRGIVQLAKRAVTALERIATSLEHIEERAWEEGE
jgi:hypothetical protein